MGLTLAVGWLGAAGVEPQAHAQGVAQEKYAGTYRIEDWQSLEQRNLHHFFYLHPAGRFLLAAAWPGNERSRFVGRWHVADGRLYLNGRGEVATNQGRWRTDYQRTFRIRLVRGGLMLEPEPLKNRYGLMGWPNPFLFHRSRPAPNLPGQALPTDPEAMLRHIERLGADLR